MSTKSDTMPVCGPKELHYGHDEGRRGRLVSTGALVDLPSNVWTPTMGWTVDFYWGTGSSLQSLTGYDGF